MTAFEGNVVVVITRNYLHTYMDLQTHRRTYTHIHAHARTQTHLHTNVWAYFFVKALKIRAFFYSNVCLDPQEKHVTLKRRKFLLLLMSPIKEYLHTNNINTLFLVDE